jgi:hypothetical protein
VFSTGDTAERLAEVFREQAHYLITNAGVALDATQERLLSAWFLSKPAAAPVEAPPPKTKAASEPRRSVEEDEPAEARPSQQRPKQPAPRPTASAKPPQVKPIDLPKSAAKPAAAKAPPPSDARDDARAVIAARIAASARIKAGTRAPAATRSAPKAPPAETTPAPRAASAQARPAPPTATPRGFQQTPSPHPPDALEDSILAAIAEAVDVLVEDGNVDERASNQQNARKKPPSPPQPAPAEDDAESGDIGDQIQRIIASYTRNREE